MFSNNLLAGVSGQGGAYSIEDSLRFNDDDSAYLSWTPSSAGNRKTWTFSAWVKLGNSGATRTLFAARLATSNSDSLQVYVTSNDQLNVGGVSYGITATPVLRDPSGWYHIVLSYDTTQATDTNRAKIYINGIQASVTGTYPSINLDTPINNTQAHNLGRRPTENDRYFDGYMAEVNFIDGQALTADDFGEIDATTGEWSPKRYSGTYGTNGFYLPFDGNANDSSGNGNNWTENNLASTDYMIDTPTNNFCTLNPLDTGGGSVTLSDGNLNYAIASSTGAQVRGTLGTGLSSKWYWEFTNGTTASPFTPVIFGISTLDGQITNNSTSLRLAAYIYTDGGINNVAALTVNGSTSSPIQTQFRSAAVSDVLQVAYDADTGKLWFGKNNVWYDAVDTTTGNPSAGLNPVFTMPTGSAMTPFLLNIGGSYSGFLNCGQRPFAYTPPTGYLALCTDNLPAPAIEQPETQFNVVTYTGTGTTLNVTGVGFQPDLVWMKRRDSANTHDLIDVVRGDTARLFPNLTDAELSDVTFSFDSDGFSPDPTKANENAAGGSYVAWCWKAGGTAVTNTDGTITSQVSANVDAGFSIVSYTGNGTAGATVGHGLGAAPEMLIIKQRNSVTGRNWHVYHEEVGASDRLYLNATSAASSSTALNNTAPSSSVITLGSVDDSNGTAQSNTYIAYCFHGVEGFSKFGSYVGNGSADGPFVYTGFRPAFVIIKATSISGESWIMFDNKHPSYNETNDFLAANLSSAAFPAGGGGVDMVSNGFKLRSTSGGLNTSGATFIYMAFAESPTKFSLGR